MDSFLVLFEENVFKISELLIAKCSNCVDVEAVLFLRTRIAPNKLSELK